jgi:hypothetical protein
VHTLSRPFIHNRRHVTRATIVGNIAHRTGAYYSSITIWSNVEIHVPWRTRICESVIIAGMNASALGVPDVQRPVLSETKRRAARNRGLCADCHINLCSMSEKQREKGSLLTF